MSIRHIRNFALLLTVIIAFYSCASTKVAKDPHAQYLGDWEYAVEELPVDIDGTFVISKEEGILNATMVNPMGEMVIEGISIEANVLKADFEAVHLLLRSAEQSVINLKRS